MTRLPRQRHAPARSALSDCSLAAGTAERIADEANERIPHEQPGPSASPTCALLVPLQCHSSHDQVIAQLRSGRDPCQHTLILFAHLLRAGATLTQLALDCRVLTFCK